MDERDIAIQITGLKKEYRLGVIGGGTLQGDIQSWIAKKRGKEDPNSKIGTDAVIKNERFLALNGIDLTIYKGERIGIIGHNGAGKSTMLKILSRVTAPTEGRICVDGRISSMLEVGTGFHGELTGRENIYLNGAILGMSRAEVSKKIEQIIDFSECRQFIDTPVKRYSSGMYVKLAFSVSAHLDADIMVMDEVLAVGDVKFQRKCLEKMSEVSRGEGRTVLYVSHNMNTIRQLCDRCVVLDHGKLIYDGDVEEAIALYADIHKTDFASFHDLREAKRFRTRTGVRLITFESIEFLNKEKNIFYEGEVPTARIILDSDVEFKNAYVRFGFYDMYDRKVASLLCPEISFVHKGKNELVVSVDFSGLVPATYRGELTIFSFDEFGVWREHDIVLEAYHFEIVSKDTLDWSQLKWGSVRLKDAVLNKQS
ncbi:MAG: ATP-binding cassette domain-containing protein [Ruminococcus sp.]|nr:ATP-binding cassette domain-containing protein [Ruminococcus sp.]